MTGYHCTHCGTRTRFDAYDTVSRRRFAHFTLGGDMEIDEEGVIAATIDRVACRLREGRPHRDPHRRRPGVTDPTSEDRVSW